MSVINQMLLDLERRRASGEERNRIPDHVRALPGSSAAPREHLLPLLIATALVLLTVTGGAYWWWQYGLPGVAKPPLIAPASEHENAERIARRMSLDLAKAPPVADSPPVTDAAAPTGITTQSVIVSEPPAWAKSHEETPARSSPPVAEVARTSSEAERQAAPKPAAKPAAVAEGPAVAKSPAVSSASSAGIDKRVREQTPRQRAEAEYSRGALALQQGRLADARSGFETALQTDPAYHAARQALAGVLLDAGQPAEAMLILQEGLQLSPAQFGFAMMAARLHVERGELDAAVQTLARSAEFAGNSSDYAGFYAGLLQRQKKHAEAVGMFDRALRLRPNSGVWLLGMGISLEALGRGAEAQEAFRRAKATGNLTPELQSYADQRVR
ncbi:MAG: hypothetical protein RJA24_948 [Pseudomonadota bacterium]|jgi:MSHA biogenesis protein MshN